MGDESDRAGAVRTREGGSLGPCGKPERKTSISILGVMLGPRLDPPSQCAFRDHYDCGCRPWTRKTVIERHESLATDSGIRAPPAPEQSRCSIPPAGARPRNRPSYRSVRRAYSETLKPDRSGDVQSAWVQHLTNRLRAWLERASRAGCSQCVGGRKDARHPNAIARMLTEVCALHGCSFGLANVALCNGTSSAVHPSSNSHRALLACAADCPRGRRHRFLVVQLKLWLVPW